MTPHRLNQQKNVKRAVVFGSLCVSDAKIDSLVTSAMSLNVYLFYDTLVMV
jgi:hypothetical protein